LPAKNPSDYLGQLALDPGVPDGVLNILPGYGETAGARLILSKKGCETLRIRNADRNVGAPLLSVNQPEIIGLNHDFLNR
jgi:hypothetical protein